MNYEKTKDLLKYHLSDTTAINNFAVPVCAAMETIIGGVSDNVSLKARLGAVGLGYLGLAFALSKGRDLSRKLFKINEKSKEKIQLMHDSLYLIGFNAIVNPALYYLSGSRNLKEIIMGTLSLSVFSAFAGGPIGYSIDIFRDLTGLEFCERKSYPDLIKRQNSKTKKGLVALLTAGSIAATAGVYLFN